MKKTSTKSSNISLFVLAIFSFMTSWIPTIEPKYKLYLLITSIIVLGMTYTLNYFNAINKIESKIDGIEKKLAEMVDLINIKSDIKLLKELYKVK